MGIRVKGQTTIFKNDKGFYSTGLSNKLMDGSYENAYIPVQFKKGIELESKTKIEIKDGFISFYRNQEGKPVFKIVVLEFEQYGDAKEPETSYSYSDDLPF